MSEPYQEFIIIDPKIHEKLEKLEPCVMKAMARRVKEAMDDMQHDIEAECAKG